MVAVAQMLPEDPEAEASVLAVLREHPELRAFIQQASAKALEFFPGASIRLDTVRYDEWDPPIQMVVHASGPLNEIGALRMDFFRWLHTELDYPDDLIFVFPQWAGDRGRS